MATQPHTSSDANIASSRHSGSAAQTGGAAEDTSATSSGTSCPTGPDGFFGARFSLYPMSDRFVPVILHAVDGLRETGLEVETDDVSTFLGGSQPVVFGALRRAFSRAAASGEHVVMNVLFSYG